MPRLLNQVFVFLCGLAAIASVAVPNSNVLQTGRNYSQYAELGGLREILPGHYVYTRRDGVTFNSGVIVTDEGVLVLDSQIDTTAGLRVREAIAQITPQPIRLLVSSPFHDFFSGGVGAFSDVHNIGHQEYRKHLLEALAGEPPDVVMARLPDQTYRERVTVYLGGKEIQILYLGRGHTRGDSVLFVPEDRIVYLSELYSHKEFPSLADSFSADWVAALDQAEAMEADIFVPGHGLITEDPRASRRGMRHFKQLLLDLREAVRTRIETGATVEEIVKTVVLPKYQDYIGYDRGLEGAIRRIYAEFTVGLE